LDTSTVQNIARAKRAQQSGEVAVERPTYDLTIFKLRCSGLPIAGTPPGYPAHFEASACPTDYVAAPRYLDGKCTFWTALKNKPLSPLSGMFQKRRGVRSGLPDVLVIFRQRPIFVELKSRRGVASKVQKQIRQELLPSGATW
jgi:hypothetical protein